MDIHERAVDFSARFGSVSKLLTALGDETRQHLIAEMIKMGECGGVRVYKIAESTNLSRASVSHHLKIMKDAGIIGIRKEGTKNYYYFEPDIHAFETLISALRFAVELSEALPNRNGDNL